MGRTQVGADQSRLEFASANVATSIKNTEAARSRLIDLDAAVGASDLANRSAQYQAGIFSLNSANQQLKHLLRLLVWRKFILATIKARWRAVLAFATCAPPVNRHCRVLLWAV